MRWWILPVVAGCSEYGLGSKVPVGDADPDPSSSGTAPPPATTTESTPSTTDEDCVLPDGSGFAGTIDETCVSVPQVGTFTPVLEWEMQSFSSVGGEVMSTPIVVEVDGDGVPDVVFVTYYPGTVRAVSGDGSGELWSQTDPAAQVQITGGVAAADLDGDGFVEIVSLRTAGVVILEHDGQIRAIEDSLAGAIYGTSDVPAISDMDHDGSPEIIAGRAILRADGTVRGIGAYGMGGVNGANVGSCSFAVDLDLDGTEEVVTGNALYRPDGSAIWFNGLPDGYPAVGNFDQDAEGEIVAVSSGEVRVIDTDGTLLHRFPVPGVASNPYGGPPTVADFDGDGAPEIGVAAGSSYSVFEVDGALLWQATTDDSTSGNTGSAVFDFEGDGIAEVVYADQTRLWVFDGRTGAVKLESADHSNGTWLEYPTIADVDGDDHAEIVVANTQYLFPSRTGITVFGDRDDSWQPGRRIWNQHAYFVTNINDDGSLPLVAAPNWSTYNHFRSGDLTAGAGSERPDLTLAQPGLCEAECDDGRLLLWIHPGNQGLADVASVHDPVLELFAVVGGAETLVQSTPLGDVPAGAFQSAVVHEVTGLDFATVEAFVARVSSDLPECDETNDEHRWEGPFCAP